MEDLREELATVEQLLLLLESRRIQLMRGLGLLSAEITESSYEGTEGLPWD